MTKQEALTIARRTNPIGGSIKQIYWDGGFWNFEIEDCGHFLTYEQIAQVAAAYKTSHIDVTGEDDGPLSEVTGSEGVYFGLQVSKVTL